jgi:hypothetical protein
MGWDAASSRSRP